MVSVCIPIGTEENEKLPLLSGMVEILLYPPEPFGYCNCTINESL